jgi:DNA polymerase III subunit beta
MKAVIPQDVLAAVTAWATATARVGRAPVTPVLAGLMLTASADGTLTAAAYDYQVSATATAAAEVGEPGRALVSARVLAEVAAMLPAGRDVAIATDGTRATLTAGQVAYRLMLLPADEFPALPEPGEPVAEFGAAWLAAAVAHAVTAAGRDDTLPALTCVQVTLDGEGTATLAATDRYRLAVATCRYTVPGSDGQTPHGQTPGTVLVPARELAAAVKRPGTATVTLALPEDIGIAALTAPDRQVTMRLGAGEYPKWGTLIPDAAAVKATVTVELPPFAEAIKRAAVVAERNTPVRLAIAGGEISIESGTGDEAQYGEAIAARLDGDPHRVNFNPAYLLDALATVAATGATSARIALTGETRPALIAPADPPEGSAVTCRHVLMPIRNAG